MIHTDRIRRSISEQWIEQFWQHPRRLFALKTTCAMTVLIVPFVLLNQTFIGITLGLGALAGALSETNDHPRGRVKALFLTIVSFFIASISVELLRPYPMLFAVGLLGSTILFIVIGGINERYRGITFGALLTAIYTMLGTEASPNWYWQPLLLPLGALSYGTVSLILLWFRPWRLLKEEMANGFMQISKYMQQKATLFPSDTLAQEKIRNRLALQNIKVVDAIERCRNVIASYSNANANQQVLSKYQHQLVLLQTLHERAASSHERYDILSEVSQNQDLIEGVGQLLRQLSYATLRLSRSLLMGKKYKHPVALKWTVGALQNQLESQDDQSSDSHQTLLLLLQNLSQSHLALQNLNYNIQSGILPKASFFTEPAWIRLKAQFNINHPRFRYAIRLSTCLLIGYGLTLYFNFVKADWILLTSLFVCQPSYSETRKRLFQRIFGTFTGVVAAILLVNILPTTLGITLLLIISTYAFFIWLKQNYSVAVIFITIFVMAAFHLQGQQGVAILTPRLIDTIIGAFLAIAVVRLLWPDWQYKKLPTLISKALERDTVYFREILNAHQAENTNKLIYEDSRHNAHRADKALVLAWKGMKLEPRKRQQFQKQAFTLTYLNHALLSYLSALGAHRDKEHFITENEREMYQKVQQALEKATNTLANDKNGQAPESLSTLLNEIGKQLLRTDKGIKRQKLVLLYNITEVIEQILKESLIMMSSYK